MKPLRTIALLALVPAATGWCQETPTPRPSGDGRGQLFHIALVLAENERSQAAPQNLPKGVEKAIADVRDFLPFKSYRIADVALVRVNGRGKVLLNGPNGEQYTASLSYQGPDEKGSFLIDQFRLALHNPPTANAQPLPRGVAPPAPEPPLESSFRISRGETVIVGSSGLGTGKGALIVILTAMP
ncbi:MAG TPA: hypothetical protein VGG03_21340 [Thermoanaerobaculia bacterium]|jgi:hypothetical protein